MRWLISLETENDPIPACRLMNVFRRKSVKISTLALAAQPDGYALLALVDTSESELEHTFNFLRRTEGVRHIASYRPEIAGEPAFFFIDAGSDVAGVMKVLQAIPNTKLVFASHGKYLLEVSAGSASFWAAWGDGRSGVLPLSLFMSSRGGARPACGPEPFGGRRPELAGTLKEK